MAGPFLQSNPTLTIVSAAALISRNSEILVQQCPPGHRHAGLWEFPGGKVEMGETPEGALVRELAEELSIEVDPVDCMVGAFASDPDQRIEHRSPYVVLLYTCRRWRGEIVPCDGQAVRWIARDALDSLSMPPLDVPLAAWLKKGG
ncbi:(deoxy)nucleoside triphosphate pyrophosphohydrolase [Blastomonas marina]|uniref:(deoxy)nucleoside triphosphate pyrophosphohydrolase n=1 Tax=Blastomonas marina TaxID=1867408 RepID=UPI001665CB56|nr:(deoxy)nucleoside triphosphate pyrophosphohydrolase [Blastomonas marina]